MSFEITPHKSVYGGEALGHAQGRTVLVPFALPGERLEVEEVRTAKGVVRARPLRILEASPDRVQPPCRYFGRCGGCQLQHLISERQPVVKREILLETLRRIGKISWDGEVALHTGHPWTYRNQAELKVGRGPEGQVEIGFFEAESHRLSPVDECLILSPRLNAVLSELRGPWAERLGDCREIELLADDRDERVMLTLRGTLNPSQGETLARDLLARLPGAASVAIECEADLHTFGDPGLDYSVGEFRYRVSPGSFFQASRFLLPELVGAVTGGESGELALDLFAGVGLFTLPLARRFKQVVAVEANPRAAAELRTNAGGYRCDNVRAVHGTVHDFARRFAQSEPDLVVLDPPRAGVGAGTLKLLLAAKPRRLHYVSCSPPTLARDLGYLRELGYGLDSIELFDFFPHTFHIECLAKLTRNRRATG